MLTHMTGRKAILLLLGSALAGAVLAAGVVASHLRAPQSPSQLDAALEGAPLTQVADIPAAPGLAAHGVFAQAAQGLVCLWDAPSASSAARQGGCNPADDPLSGHRLSASLAYDGGPATRDVTDARLIGLAAPDVAAVAVTMSDGSRRRLQLRAATVAGGKYRAFGYRFRQADLRRGIEPTAVLALDASGREIDRQPTGFGG